LYSAVNRILIKQSVRMRERERVWKKNIKGEHGDMVGGV
jgi:hypothetical protein